VSRIKVHFDEKTIDAIFRDLDPSQLPGAAVGIAIGGVPVYRKGFGLASMELPVALTPQTRMRIYSTTKHFTCLAYLLLCEEGKASIDDRVGKYLPDLHLVVHNVTMRQLMSHTSGLRDACDIRWFFSGIEGTVPAHDLLALYRYIDDVNFLPGEAWSYNNGGYHILSAVIEKLADMSLEEVFRTRIFEPVGMHDTLLRRVDTDFVRNSATMHMLGRRNVYEKTYLPGELAGEGGIVSTVEDMLLWMRNASNPVIGSPDTWGLMSTSQSLNDGMETGYGLGLFLNPYKHVAMISHSGLGLGSNSEMIRIPSAALDIIVLVNRSDISSTELAARILDDCLGIRSEPSPSDAKLLTGLFRCANTGQVVRLYGREGLQMASIDGGEETRMVLTGDRELGHLPHACSPLAISWSEDDAEPGRLHYEEYGNRNELLRIPIEPDRNVVVIPGDYLAAGIGVCLRVETCESNSDHKRVILTGRFGSRLYELERLGACVWRLIAADRTGWWGTLMVEPDGRSLVLKTPNTWKVTFRRST